MTAGALIRHRACIDPLSLMSWLLSNHVESRTIFWSNLRNCKFGPKIRIWRCCPEMVEKCIKFERLGPGFGQTEEIANLDLKVAKQALGVFLGA